MTRPNRPPQRRASAAMAAAMSGAVDLSALKERALAAKSGSAGAGSAVPAAEGVVADVNEATFEQQVLQKSNQLPVVVLMWSRRSPASAQFGDLLAQLAADDGGRWHLARVEAEPNMQLARLLGVQGIPHTVAVAAGRPVGEFDGVLTPEDLRAWVDSLLAATEGKLAGVAEAGDAAEETSDPRFDAAEQALDDGDYPGAEAAYQQILDAEPGNKLALDALRQVRFLARVADVPHDAIAAADAEPTSVEKQLAAADLEMVGQQPDAAFDRLIAAIKRSSGDDRTTARTRLLELFELFDSADPLVVAARRRLAAALY